MSPQSRTKRPVDEAIAKAMALDPQEQWAVIERLAGSLEQAPGFEVEYDGENVTTIRRNPGYLITLKVRVDNIANVDNVAAEIASRAEREIAGVVSAEVDDWDEE